MKGLMKKFSDICGQRLKRELVQPAIQLVQILIINSLI